jgi:excisionase family DNA binding protein
MTEEFLESLPPFLPIGPRTDKSVVRGVTTACDMVGCGKTKMYDLISKGCVKAVKMGRFTKIDTASLLDFLSKLPEVQVKVAA